MLLDRKRMTEKHENPKVDIWLNRAVQILEGNTGCIE